MTSISEDTKKTNLDDHTPRIGVIGVGGGGGNAINNMIKADIKGANFLAANTDAQALTTTLASHSIQLGLNLTNGLGSGAQVNIGRAAAEESTDEIRKWVEKYDLLFIAAGMGGGTGTGAIPVIAKIAKEENTLSIAVVTLPFDFEGSQRMSAAKEGLRDLENLVNTLIIIPNQNLFAIANTTTTLANAFTLADGVIVDAVRSITELIILPGMINLDFADVRAIVTKSGRAMMGTGVASGACRAKDAAEAAIANPLLETASIKGAKGLLINITGGPDMTLFEIDEAVNRIRAEVRGDCFVIFGSVFDPTLEGSLRVSIVATGLGGLSQLNSPQPELRPFTEPETVPEPRLDPAPELELDLKGNPKGISKQSNAPTMETVRDAVNEHADNEPMHETQTSRGSQPIPAPTMPRPENPRLEKTTEPSVAIQIPQSKPYPNVSVEAGLQVEPVANKKKKPKLSWRKKIFGFD